MIYFKPRDQSGVARTTRIRRRVGAFVCARGSEALRAGRVRATARTRALELVERRHRGERGKAVPDGEALLLVRHRVEDGAEVAAALAVVVGEDDDRNAGVVADGARQAEMASIAVWAEIPHYAAQVPCPKATLAMLVRLEDLLDTVIDHDDLEDEAQAWERGVDELARTDEDVADYVSALESAQDTTELPEASGDAIAKEFERYLRRRGDGSPGKG